MSTQELANWAAVFSTVMAAAGLFVLMWQIRLQRKDQKAQVVFQLFEETITPEFRDKLRFVYYNSPEDLVLSELDESHRAFVDEVTARFDGLGYRVRKGMIPKQETVEIFWDWVIRCAQKLQLHIQDQRQRRGPSDIYRAEFDWLARECKLYHLKRLLGYRGSTKNKGLDELLKIQPLQFFSIETPTEEGDFNSTSS